MKIKNFAFAILMCSLTATAAADWKKLVGGTSANNSAAVSGVTGTDMLTAFSTSANLIGEAHVSLAKALDLNELAATAEAELAAQRAGVVSEKDTLDSIAKRGDEINAELEKKSAEGFQLNEEAKAHYLAAILPYSLGLVGARTAVDAAPSFTSNAKARISAASLIQKPGVTRELSGGVYVAKELPGFSKGLWQTSKLMLTFAKANNIEVPADATKTLTSDMF